MPDIFTACDQIFAISIRFLILRQFIFIMGGSNYKRESLTHTQDHKASRFKKVLFLFFPLFALLRPVVLSAPAPPANDMMNDDDSVKTFLSPLHR